MPDDCGWMSPGCHVKSALQGEAEEFAEAMERFAAKVLQDAMTWWVDMPTSNPDQPAVAAAQFFTWPLVGVLLVASMLAAGIRIALSRKGDALIDVALGTVKFTLVSTMGLTALGTATAGMDALTAWALDAAGQTFVFGLIHAMGLDSLGTIGLIVVSVCVMVLGIIQWILGFLRQAGLIIFAVFLPLAAAGSLAPWGKRWLPSLLSSLVALVVYEYCAALIIIIGQAFLVAGQGLQTALTGVMILIGSIVALPVLLKFFSPLGVSLASGGGALGSMAGGMLGSRLGSGGGGASGAGSGAAGMSPATQQARAISETGPGSGQSPPSGASPGAARPGQTSAPGGPSAPGTGQSGGSGTGPGTGAGGAASSAGALGPAGAAGGVAGAASGSGGAAGGASGAGASAGGPAGAAAGVAIEGGKKVYQTSKQGVEEMSSPPSSPPPGGAPS